MIHNKFKEIIPNEGHMGMIFGDVRSGKSCLGYGLLEHLSIEYNRDAYVFGLPKEKAHLLPPSITPIYTLDDLAENTIVLFDEAYISFYSRMSSSDVNKMMDTLAGLVGQKNILAIYITQQTRRLEIGVVSSVGWICSKRPSLLQSRFDRKELRGIIKEVYDEFNVLVPPEGMSKKDHQKRCTYVVSGDFEGMIKNSNTPPSFWSEDLSKAFEGVSISSNTQKEEKAGGLKMNEKQRECMLTKFAVNGFAVFDGEESELVLRPRGMEERAEIVLRETPVGYEIVRSSGAYAGTKKRTFFQNNLDMWASECLGLIE